jgi:S1-C subfamily serine protease
MVVMRNLLSGIVGGVAAVAIGAILIAIGVIDTGEKTTVVERQAPLASESKPASERAGGLTVSDIYRKAGPGVAFIQAHIVEQTSNPFGFPEQQQGEASGSGFVLNDEGYIATNAHVVDGASDVRVRFGHGASVPAKIVGKDLSTDLAVIKVDPSKVDLTPVPLGESKSVSVGDPVVAIGNPFGYEDTVTTGIVSALGREIQAPNTFTIGHAIQTDAAINPGNSGGPLLDANGRVIGINSQIATGGGGKGSIGIGFAIPVDLAKTVFPQLIKSGEVKHAYIGVTTVGVPAQLAHDLNLPTSSGALVQSVAPGSPADKAGLRAGNTDVGGQIVAGGDLIVGIDGRPIKSPTDITSAIADNQPGDTVTIDYYRGTAKRTATLTLGNRPNRADSAAQPPTIP